MKFFKMLLAIIIALNLFNCTGKDTTVSKEKLLQVIDEFNTAFQEGNVGLIESLITDNYMHTNGNSKSIRKPDWINYLSKREQEIKSGSLKVIEYKMDEIEIEIHNNTAIVTGKVFVSNKIKGEIIKNIYRITNIWTNINGNWKRAGFHDGKIK